MFKCECVYNYTTFALAERSGVVPQWNFYKYLLDHEGNVLQVCTVLYIVLYCTVLHCTVLHCRCGRPRPRWRISTTRWRPRCTRLTESSRSRVRSGPMMSCDVLPIVPKLFC